MWVTTSSLGELREKWEHLVLNLYTQKLCYTITISLSQKKTKIRF